MSVLSNPGPGGPAPENPDPNQVKSDNALKKSKNNTPEDEYQAILDFEELLGTTNVADEIRMHAWQRLGCSYFKVKNYHAAISSFDKAIDYDKNSPVTVNAYLYKGVALLKIRKPRQARENFFKAQNTIKVLPSTVSDNEKTYLHATVLHQIGISLSQTNHDDEALDYFNDVDILYKEWCERHLNEKSLKIEKVRLTAQISRGLSLCLIGRREEARKLIRKTINDLESPGNETLKKYLVSAQNVLGIINLYDTETEDAGKEALAAFDNAIGIAKSLPPEERPLYLWKGYYNKGLALKNAQKFTEAIACFTEGLKECDKLEPHLLYARGITKIELQKYEEGISDLQEVQQFDPRYSPAIIALGDAYRKKSIYFREVELQKQILESTTAAVDTTQRNLKDLSDDMRSSLKHVSWLFYILFSVGMAVFLLSLYFAFRQPSPLAETAIANTTSFLNTTAIANTTSILNTTPIANTTANPSNTLIPNPMALAVSAIGGIDVILSMIFLSPTKIQKNRIDYSQWLMGYFNWVNTQFAASMVMLERLQNVHSPSKPKTEEFDWNFAQPIYSFLNTMTNSTLETIDKCCEFPDAQYSLSKKTDTKTNGQDSDTGTSTTDKPASPAPKAKTGDSGNTTTETASEVKNVSAAGNEKSKKPEPEPTLPEGFKFVSTGNKALPGHVIKDADISRGIPAIVFSCWRGAATDNRYIPFAHIDAGTAFETGTKPEPLSKPFTIEELTRENVNILFAVVGYRQANIQIGIRFMYLDETRSHSTLPNTADYILAKKDEKTEAYFIRYHDEILLAQQVYGDGNKQVYIDYVEMPHDHPIDKAIGKHYVTFRIAEIIPGQPDYVLKNGIITPREIEWLWESEPFEFTITDKKA
nr:tetratricopeptide repeat protein [uncultured Methanoregula sp.]